MHLRMIYSSVATAWARHRYNPHLVTSEGAYISVHKIFNDSAPSSVQ